MSKSRDAIQEAIETQRLSIAGEIHDSLLPYLFATRMRLETLCDNLSRAGARSRPSLTTGEICDEIKLAVASIQHAMTVGRQAIAELHPSELNDVSWHDQLYETANRFSEKAKTDLRIDGDFDAMSTNDNVRLAARRIAQESIYNAIRHGRSKQIDVVVNATLDAITLTIGDDGRGFDPSTKSHGYGLRLMAMRATSVGAELSVASRPGGPTTVTLRCPADALPH